MNFPERVKIGGLMYEVSFAKHLARDGGSLGQSCGNDQKILIEEDLPRQMQESTFVHELLHQISFVYNLDFDEDMVRRLEAALYAFLKDNPEIMKGGS